MEMTGEQLIPAERQQVWDALNDPEILKQCIPGCQTLDRTGDNGFEATVQAKVGPVKAKFKGAVTFLNIDAPNSYTISGEGKGGAAGFAKGSADVKLEDAPEGTLLTYKVNAKVGGKLAQIGSRLIDSSAKKMAGEFFQEFSNALAPKAEAEKPEQPTEPAPAKADKAEATASMKETAAPAKPTPNAQPAAAPSHYVPLMGLHPFVWTVGLVALIVGLVFLFSGSGH